MSNAKKFWWCLHCYRTYRKKSTPKYRQRCPHCKASTFSDGWEWSRLVRLWGYPETPEDGKVYPQYGPDQKL